MEFYLLGCLLITRARKSGDLHLEWPLSSEHLRKRVLDEELATLGIAEALRIVDTAPDLRLIEWVSLGNGHCMHQARERVVRALNPSLQSRLIIIWMLLIKNVSVLAPRLDDRIVTRPMRRHSEDARRSKIEINLVQCSNVLGGEARRAGRHEGFENPPLASTAFGGALDPFLSLYSEHRAKKCGGDNRPIADSHNLTEVRA